MAIQLQKGQRVDIAAPKFSVGLGWDPGKNSAHPYDLDVSAFMVGENGKIPNENFLVFYNSSLKTTVDGEERPVSEDGAVVGSVDDQEGDESDGGDDEVIDVDISKINSQIREIIFVVTIHEWEERSQNFGQVRNSYIRICDSNTDEEICKYELDEDFSTVTAVEFGRLYQRGDKWRFEAMGNGITGGLGDFVTKYHH
ncbi:MAG: TerD family protein [Luteolibacter sp.]